MWCKTCERESFSDICEICGQPTVTDIPSNIYWCNKCKTPIIRKENDRNKTICPICKSETKYLCTDLRPVFPEERLLFEILIGKPFEYKDCSVWANNNRYYIDGKAKVFSTSHYENSNIEEIRAQLQELQPKNSYEDFDKQISVFSQANKTRLEYLIDEAHNFIQEQASPYR